MANFGVTAPPAGRGGVTTPPAPGGLAGLSTPTPNPTGYNATGGGVAPTSPTGGFQGDYSGTSNANAGGWTSTPGYTGFNATPATAQPSTFTPASVTASNTLSNAGGVGGRPIGLQTLNVRATGAPGQPLSVNTPSAGSAGAVSPNSTSPTTGGPIPGTVGPNSPGGWTSTPGNTGFSAAPGPAAALSPYGNTPLSGTATPVWGPNGIVSNINPNQVGSQSLAQQIAQQYGGTVINAPMVSNQAFGSAPQPWVQLPNGQTVNPADIAGLYSHGYSQPYVNQLVAQALNGQALAGFGTGFENQMSAPQLAAANVMSGNAYGGLGITPSVPQQTANPMAQAVPQTATTTTTGTPGVTSGQNLTPGTQTGNDLQQFMNFWNGLSSGQISPTQAYSSIQSLISQGFDPSLFYMFMNQGGSSNPLYTRSLTSQFP